MKKNNSKKDLEEIADQLIDAIAPLEPIQPSPFFKTKVLARIDEISSTSKPSLVFENFFFRSAAAAVAILFVVNAFMVYKSVNANQTNQTEVDQLISQYQVYENETYTDYNLLASDNLN